MDFDSIFDQQCFFYLRTNPFVLHEPGVYAFRVVSVITGQESQLIAIFKIIQTDATGLEGVSGFELVDGQFLQGRLRQPVPHPSPVVLDAFVNDDAEHDDEADPDHDGERQQVGVDVEGLVVDDYDTNVGIGFPSVMLEELPRTLEADENGRNEVVITATHWYHLIMNKLNRLAKNS